MIEVVDWVDDECDMIGALSSWGCLCSLALMPLRASCPLAVLGSSSCLAHTLRLPSSRLSVPLDRVDPLLTASSASAHQGRQEEVG